jgi:NitT/TauT family transport system ATP-binding protein
MMKQTRPDEAAEKGVTLIAADSVTKIYRRNRRDFAAVTNCSFEVLHQEFLVIVGPTGSGKSTLLKMIAGLEMPTKGTITHAGQVVDRPSAERGMLFQEYSMLPWRTVQGNVEFGMELGRLDISAGERKAKAVRYLDMVGLLSAKDKYPGELSGGMKRRVTLAMTLVTQPQVLLMDGAFNALDTKTKMGLHGEIVQIWQQEKVTVLFITSDPDEAVKLSDRIMVLNKQGEIACFFENDLPRQQRLGKPEPGTPHYRRFLELKHEVLREIKACEHRLHEKG